MKLSVRESEVLNLLQHGLTNKQIGLQLKLSPYTVRDMVCAMLARFGLNGRTALVVLHIKESSQLQAGQPNLKPTGADNCAPSSPINL